MKSFGVARAIPVYLALAYSCLWADTKSDQIAALKAQLEEARNDKASLQALNLALAQGRRAGTSANTAALKKNTAVVQERTARSSEEADQLSGEVAGATLSTEKLAAELRISTQRADELSAKNAAASSHDRYIFLGLIVTAIVTLGSMILPQLTMIRRVTDRTHVLANGNYGSALDGKAAALRANVAALRTIAEMRNNTPEALADVQAAELLANAAEQASRDHRRASDP